MIPLQELLRARRVAGDLPLEPGPRPRGGGAAAPEGAAAPQPWAEGRGGGGGGGVDGEGWRCCVTADIRVVGRCAPHFPYIYIYIYIYIYSTHTNHPDHPMFV